MTAVSPELVPLSHSELENYRKIAVETFKQTFDAENSEANMQAYLEKAYNLAALEKELDPARSAVFLAKLNGQTVGYLKVNFPPAFTHPTGDEALELERIYVDKTHKGKRIGDTLLRKAIAMARERGCRFLWLGVWEHNLAARAFYEKKGFTVFGSHPFAVGEDIQTDLLMRLNL